MTFTGASQVALVIKNLPTNTGDIRDAGSIPGLEGSPGRGHGNPLHCSCLQNARDRGAWRATGHRVTKKWTQLRRLSTHMTTVAGMELKTKSPLNTLPKGGIVKENTYIFEQLLKQNVMCIT